MVSNLPSPTTPTDILNLSLVETGSRVLISNLASDTSAQAITGRILYTPKIQALLRSAHWDFARGQEPLGLEASAKGPADGARSFVNNYVPPPTGKQPVPARLQPGDVLFFNGSVIHGSEPNTHPTLWRRSFICHYMPAAAQEIVEWYFPLHDFHGNVIERKSAALGGPCGPDFDWSKLEKFA